MRWPTIAADPPWGYPSGNDPFVGGQWSGDGDPHRWGTPYSPMALEDICALPVERFAEDVAFLWLWIPHWHLMAGWHWAVAMSWGFPNLRGGRYWRKNRHGAGYWFMHRIEHLVLFTRGPKPSQHYAQGLDQEIRAKVGEHSTKPDAAYRDIETACPGPYLELFARRPRPDNLDLLHTWGDWTVWGDEVGDPLGIGFDPRGWRDERGHLPELPAADQVGEDGEDREAHAARP